MKKKILYVILCIVFVLLLVVASLMINNTNKESLNINKVKNEDLNNQISNIDNIKNEEELNQISKIIEVNDENFEIEVLKNEKPVLIDFYATWCNPCKYLSPIIEQISNENDNLKVVKVDVDKSPNLVKKYMIYSMPTVVLFGQGEEINRLNGAAPKEMIEKFIIENINKI